VNPKSWKAALQYTARTGLADFLHPSEMSLWQQMLGQLPCKTVHMSIWSLGMDGKWNASRYSVPPYQLCIWSDSTLLFQPASDTAHTQLPGGELRLASLTLVLMLVPLILELMPVLLILVHVKTNTWVMKIFTYHLLI
jgi:hypothetical protein